MEITDLVNLFTQEGFISIVLLLFFIIYGFFAVVLSIQISTYNKIMTQEGFGPVFSLIGYINVGLSIAFILMILFSL